MINNFKTYIYFFVFLIVLVSCTEQKLNKKSFKSFLENIDMSKRQIDNFSIPGCLDPSYLNIYDTLIIITQNKLENGIFSFYGIKSKKLVASFGRQGKALNEFVQPAYTEVDKKNGLFWFIDYPTTTFYAYSISEILKDSRKVKPIIKIKFDHTYMPIFNYHILDDTSIMIPSSNKNSLCTIINTKGEIVKTHGSQPMFDSEDLPKQAYNDLHARLIKTDIEKGEIVFAYHYYDKLLKYNYSLDKYWIVTGPDHIKQDGEALENGLLYRPITIKKGYFYSFKKANGKLYALYNGKPQFNKDYTANYPNIINVFDWDLNPLEKLEFDKSIIAFDIDENSNTLYAITGSSINNFLSYSLK
ncbi:MAG TPA: BF3164 family lipoprotein [Bacteroidales bacterium]|nr:BF3164 family lipoprotein [Bacteroidales bacterium]